MSNSPAMVQFVGDILMVRQIIRLSWTFEVEHTYFHTIPNTTHAIVQFPISVFGDRYDEFTNSAFQHEQYLTVTTHPKIYTVG